ncbi:MAG: PIN domain-containing protein, partial [Patescibacteria group bacterium]
QLFRTILIVDVDFSIAREAARIRREQKLKTIDSVIAATAVILHAPLVSRDMVFKHIRDIEVIIP